MEAVVKSLDPNNTTNMDALLDTATEIIGYVVKSYVSPPLTLIIVLMLMQTL